MTLRKLIPATLLLLAACASPATTAETQSVGMDKTATKSCCSNLTAEQKAHCEAAAKAGCCEKDKVEAPKPNN